MRFADRTEAGKKLAQALEKYKNSAGIIYPLPRGGIVLGVEIAKALNMPIDLIIPRKIGHPYNPEYAIAAVAENGETVCNIAEVEKLDSSWFKRAVERERKEARRRRRAYLPNKEPIDATGKIMIIVDDGIATGLTMRAAIRDARERNGAKIIVAIPVAPRETINVLAREVDEVVVVEEPDVYLGAVGAYYDKFDQVTDEEVLSMLGEVD